MQTESRAANAHKTHACASRWGAWCNRAIVGHMRSCGWGIYTYMYVKRIAPKPNALNDCTRSLRRVFALCWMRCRICVRALSHAFCGGSSGNDHRHEIDAFTRLRESISHAIHPSVNQRMYNTQRQKTPNTLLSDLYISVFPLWYVYIAPSIYHYIFEKYFSLLYIIICICYVLNLQWIGLDDGWMV